MENVLKRISETRVKLDYNLGLIDLLAEGGYEAGSDICEEFFLPPPLSQALPNEVSLFLFSLTGKIKTADLLLYFRKKSYRPANFHELLAWGKENYKINYSFPIIALDSLVKETGCGYGAPALLITGSRRKVDVLWLNYVWKDNYGFLAAKL